MDFLSDGSQVKKWMHISCKSMVSEDTHQIGKNLKIGLASDGVLNVTGTGSAVLGHVTGSDAVVSSINDGNVTFGKVETQGKIENTGDGALCFGRCDTAGELKANGEGSFAGGHCDGGAQIVSDHSGSLAFGRAIGSDSLMHVNEQGAIALGYVSAGAGFLSDGAGSIALGYSSGVGDSHAVHGTGSTILGRSLFSTSSNPHSLVTGQWGTSKSSIAGVNTILGSGSLQICGGADAGDSADGVAVSLGHSVAALDPSGGGTGNYWQTTGALTSMLLEVNSDSKLLDGEDHIGSFVKLVNGKLSLSESDEDVLGVVCEKSQGICSNTEDLRWKGCSLKDKYNRKIIRKTYIQKLKKILDKYEIEINDEVKDKLNEDKEEIKEQLVSMIEMRFSNLNTIQQRELKLKELYEEIVKCESKVGHVLNINYDMKREYVCRSKRPEWLAVALTNSMVCVNCDSDVEVGDWVSCQAGRAVQGDKYCVLEKTAKDVAVILLR